MIEWENPERCEHFADCYADYLSERDQKKEYIFDSLEYEREVCSKRPHPWCFEELRA